MRLLLSCLCGIMLLSFSPMSVSAGPIAILDNLNDQDIKVARLDDSTLDKKRAKADYFLRMTYPTDHAEDHNLPPTASFQMNQWYEIHLVNGGKIDDRYYSDFSWTTAVQTAVSFNSRIS